MRSADARRSGGTVTPLASRTNRGSDADAPAAASGRGFPVAAGIFLGLGLGGFFDGIVLHQLLQWHHMATSAGYPADSVENLRLNTLLDGLFHALTYVFVVAGIALLWMRLRDTPMQRWWGPALAGTILAGFGIFNVVEGTINHHLLGLHHVNETAPREQWIWWDVGFLAWGALMLLAGWALVIAARRRGAGPAVEARTHG